MQILTLKNSDCIFCTSILIAASQVEKFPYSCRPLFTTRFFSKVKIGETSPTEMYSIAPLIFPFSSEFEILC